ncbi:MAG: folate-binding protein [Actinomycetaceae bacterium]|nr:folate-binding protein [Actinomycetaceae bacterium]
MAVDFSARPGAVVVDAIDAFVPAHYGQPGVEQRALEEGRAIVDLSSLGVVEVVGPHPTRWLTTLSSQVIPEHAEFIAEDVSVGGRGGSGVDAVDDIRIPEAVLRPGTEVLLLDFSGRLDFAFAVIPAGRTDTGETGRVLLIVDSAEEAARLSAFLETRIFLADIKVADVSDGCGVLGAVWPAGGDPLSFKALYNSAVQERALVGTWVDPWPGVVEGGTRYSFMGDEDKHPGSEFSRGLVVVYDDAVEGVGARALGLMDDVLDVASGVDAGQARWAGMSAWEANRVASGRPRKITEVDEKTLPHELDWLRTAVHLRKGCYCGQETVAKIINMGKPPRRLTWLMFDGAELPEVGAVVSLDEGGQSAVGRVTSAVRHVDEGVMALAVLRRNVDVAVPLWVAGLEVPGIQRILVDPVGRSADSPKERPGAGLRKSLLTGRSKFKCGAQDIDEDED